MHGGAVAGVLGLFHRSNGREVFLFFIAVAAKQTHLQLSAFACAPSSYFVSLGSFKVLWTH